MGVKYITSYRQPVKLNFRRRQKEGALLEISSVTVFTSPFHKVDIENLVLVVIGKNSVKIFKKKLKMPKEFHDFDMTKPPGASWGIRIGGGVDRGKVLVLEKIIFNTIAYETGLKERDFIVEINGTTVFEMDHNMCKDLIKKAGDNMNIK